MNEDTNILQNNKNEFVEEIKETESENKENNTSSEEDNWEQNQKLIY